MLKLGCKMIFGAIALNVVFAVVDAIFDDKSEGKENA